MNPFKTNKDKKTLYLYQLIQSIGNAVTNSEVEIDKDTLHARDRIIKKDARLEKFPTTTFQVKDVSISLKFVIDKLREKDNRVAIRIDPDVLEKVGTNVSEIKFNLHQKTLVKYEIDGKKFTREE
jgi:hypothetical protein